MRREHVALVISLPDGSRIEHPLDVVDEHTVRAWLSETWRFDLPADAVWSIEEVTS